jgi:hypothetical protein
MKPKRNKKIRTFVYFVQLRGELNHASLKQYLPNDPHKSLKCLFVKGGTLLNRYPNPRFDKAGPEQCVEGERQGEIYSTNFG